MVTESQGALADDDAAYFAALVAEHHADQRQGP